MRDELRHTLILAFGTGFGSLLRIAYVVYVARVLGPADYADFYAMLTVVLLFATGMAPIYGTVSRFISLYAARGDHDALAGLRVFARGQVWRIVGGLIVASPLVVLVLRSQLSLDSWTLPALTAATLPLMLLVELPRGELRGAHRFGGLSINLAAEAALRLVFCVALLALATTPEAALLAHLTALLITLPMAAAQARPIARDASPRVPDGAMLRRFAGNLFAVAFIGAGLQTIDVLVARTVFPDLEAGLYSAASSLARVIGLIYLPFAIQLLPMLTDRHSKGRAPGRALAAVMAAFGVLSLTVVAVLSLAADTALRLLFGAAYLGAQPLIAPLGVALTFTFLALMIGHAFTALSSFRFVPYYFAALVAEIGILWWSSGSTATLAVGLMVSQILAFAVMLLCFIARRTPPLAADQP